MSDQEISDEELDAIEKRWEEAHDPRTCTAASVLFSAADTGRLIEATRRWREIERCAAGVVRTAHPDVTEYMVADGWWNALIAALAHPESVAREEEG